MKRQRKRNVKFNSLSPHRRDGRGTDLEREFHVSLRWAGNDTTLEGGGISAGDGEYGTKSGN